MVSSPTRTANGTPALYSSWATTTVMNERSSAFRAAGEVATNSTATTTDWPSLPSERLKTCVERATKRHYVAAMSDVRGKSRECEAAAVVTSDARERLELADTAATQEAKQHSTALLTLVTEQHGQHHRAIGTVWLAVLLAQQ